MPTDLQKMTVAELDALIERAHEVRETTRERRRLDLKTEIETKLKGEGFTPFPKDQRSPATAGAMMTSEIERWGQVIRDNNIQVTQ